MMPVYIAFSADGQHIRFWSRDPWLAKRFEQDTGAATVLYQPTAAPALTQPERAAPFGMSPTYLSALDRGQWRNPVASPWAGMGQREPRTGS